MSESSARFALKARTAEAHERLDGLFSRFDLADPAGYADFLRAQSGALWAVEAALDKAGAAGVLTDWPARRRGDALADDLARLGIASPASMPFVILPDEASVLGAIYVLEGSRLGGAMLVRTVPDTLPKSFLSPRNPLSWRAFVTVIDERLRSGAALDAAAESAASVFHTFEASARQILGADRT